MSSPARIDTAVPGGVLTPGAGAPDPADSTAPNDAPVLPPEPVWRATLLALLRVSRSCYELGLSVLLRNLTLAPFYFESPDLLAAFVEDGLGVDKFRFVRSLKLSIYRGPEFYDLFGKLLRNVCRHLEEFTITADAIQLPSFGDPCREMPRLKRLRIKTTPVAKKLESPTAPGFDVNNRNYDASALPYYGLLASAEKMDHLETFELDEEDIKLCQYIRPAGLKSWAEKLVSFPSMQKRLSFVSLVDADIPEWAAYPAPTSSFVTCRYGNAIISTIGKQWTCFRGSKHSRSGPAKPIS